MATSGTYVTEVPLKGSAEEHYKRWKSETTSSLTPSATTSKMSPFTKANTTLMAPLGLGTTLGEIFKEKREVDDENYTLTLRGLDGHVMEQLKVYDVIYQFIPKPEGNCSCKITIIWEKRNEDSPEPSGYMKFVKSLVADMDHHVVRKA